ncbi:hypothetical protein ACWNG8_06815 [Aeromonas veronii]
MGALANSGRAAVAVSIKAQPIHLAWRRGDVAWDATPSPETPTTSDLVAEVGRRRVTQSLFCTPDPTGEIVVSEGRFTATIEPTNYLYLRFAFDFTDAQDETIRELGVFVGTEAKPTTPVGQDYLLPGDIEVSGTLLVYERIQKLVRGSQVRQQFEFVMQF